MPGHELGGQLQLTQEVQSKLLSLQLKGIDINALLTDFLKKKEYEIAQEKEELAAATPENSSRYIPAKVKKVLEKESGTKCSINGCTKNAETIHHTQKFALSKNHNPYYLALLCKNHHTIAHSIDVKFHEVRLQ